MDCPFKNPGKWKESDLTLEEGENKRRDEGRCLVTRRDWWQEWWKLREGEKKKKPSGGFGSTPDDESNDNTGHGQHHKQDANLLPRALLQKGGTNRLLTVERWNVNPHQKTVMSSRWHTEWLMVNQIGLFFLFFLGATRPFLSLDLFTKTNSAAQRSPCVAAEGVTGGDKFTGKWYSHFRTFLPQPLTRPTLMLCSTCLAKY